MKRNFHHLTFTDRLRIEALVKAGASPSKIAKQLEVHSSTIYRELKRGTYTHMNSDLTTEERYSPDIAEQKYRENLSAKGPDLKIGNDLAYAEYLERMVAEKKYAPGAVLGEIKRKGLVFNTSISKTTFYRYIDDGVFLNITNKDLPVKKNKKKKYHKVRPSRSPAGKSIERRPKEIDTRSSFGHWEMDCVEGKKGTKKTLLVLTERKTRGEIVRLMPDKTISSVKNELDALEAQLGSKAFCKLFKTITCDNGAEFQDPESIERSIYDGTRTSVYYCHPYCAHERGSNENCNRFIRRWYPKGTDFNATTLKDIERLEEWINNYPREQFNYYSAADLFMPLMASCTNS